MREPRISDLEFDPKGTRQVRHRVARKSAIKITINIGADSLAILRLL